MGLLQPIVISENYELIAGQRRLEACKTLGWTEIAVNIVNLADIVRGEIDENTTRKDFTASEMAAIKKRTEPMEREAALARQVSGQPAAESDRGRVADRIASAVGVSRDTLMKAEVIAEAAEKDPEKFGTILEKVDRKEMSINAAYKELEPKAMRPRKSKEAKDTVYLPAELFSEMQEALDRATKEGERNVALRHNGHEVKHAGNIELTT